MTGIKQSDFAAVTSVDSADNIPLFTTHENKRITYANMLSQLTDEIAVRFIYPTIAQLQQSGLEADEDEPNYVRCEETEYRLYKITSLSVGVDDIALDNGRTASYQEEYSKSGFVLGAASSTNNALALFDGTTGTQLKTGAVLSTIGGNLASATSIAQVSYPRVGADNSVTMATPTALKTDLNLPANTASSISTIEGDISAIEGDISTIEGDVAFLDDNIQIQIETWADIATVTPTAAGQLFTLKQHTSSGLGGGTLMAFAGSVTDDGGTQKNALGGFYLKRIDYSHLTSDMFGVTSTGTNLQSFLDASEGKYAQLSPSTYTLSTKYTVRPNTALFGVGATVKMAAAYSVSQSLFVADDGAVIYGIEFDGNYASNTSHTAAMCEIGNFARYEKCKFSKTPYIGLSPLTDGDTCYVNECEFIADTSTTGLVGSYIGLWYDAPNVTVYCDDCYFEGFRINGIFAGGYSVINNPKMFNCHKQTTPVGGGHIASGINVKYCQINNPIIDGNNNAAASGIELDNINMHVSSGFIKKCGFFGVIVQSGEGHSVSGVTCTENGLSGIQCGANVGSDVVRNFTVDGNTCYDNGGYGIVVDTNVGDNWQVVNNNCYGNTSGDAPIILRKTAISVVEGNIPTESNFTSQTVSSEIHSASAVSLAATATSYNLTSIVLDPGTWDVESVVNPVSGASTVTNAFNGSISTVSATIPSAPALGASGLWRGNVTGDLVPWVRASVRLNLSVQTTVYLVVRSTFTTSTQSAYGAIIAKRAY